MELLSKLTGETDKRILMICSFIMLAGLSSGIFFTAMMPQADKSYLTEFMHGAMSSNSLRLLPLFIYNILLLALITLSALSVYGFPLAALFFFCRAMFLGVCIPLVISLPAAEMLPFLFFNLLLLLLFLTVTTLCISYGLSQLDLKK